MRVIELDASDWKSVLDFYGAVNVALEQPEMVGQNLNALLELLVWEADRNPVRPPFTVRIVGAEAVPAEVRSEIALLSVLVANACLMYPKYDWTGGRQIDVRLESDVSASEMAAAHMLAPPPPPDYDPNRTLMKLVSRIRRQMGLKG